MKEELQYRAPDSSVILSDPVILSEAKNLSLSVVLCQSTELPLIYEEEEDW